jgi:cytochrome P450
VSETTEKPSAMKCPIAFDHHGAHHSRRWPEVYSSLRETCPRSWVDRYDGFWLATKYSDILSISQRTDVISVVKEVDPDTGAEVGGVTIPTAQGARSIPNELDSPEWDRVRGFMTRKFSPKAADNLRDRTEQLMNMLVDEFIETGRLDFVEHITNPLPGMVTVEILGFPLHEWKAFSDPIHQFVSLPRNDPRLAEAAAGILHFRDRVDEEIALRRKEPREDLLSYFAHGTIEGEPLPYELIQDLAWQIMSGGVDTTGSAAANAFLYLGRNPERRRWLREDPARLPRACEEFVRYFTPIQGAARTVKDDAEIDGWRLREGDRLLLAYASGNRDPEKFEDPEDVRLDRSPNRHIGFGAGQHRCLGAFLARMMFQRLLEVFLRRIPDYEIDESGVAHYPSVGFVNGLVSLPATFTPGPRVGGASAG